MSCKGQPFVQLAAQTSCAESPPCSHILCYSDIRCLLANSLAPIVAGCRSEKELFCICPLRSWRKLPTMSNTTEIITEKDADNGGGGISGGAVVGIVLGVLAGVALLALATYYIVRFVRDRRRNHGEYRPQMEEQHHAKDLPYLQPPAIEGLI